MFRSRRNHFSPVTASTPDRSATATENAWKLHATLVDWTGKVDTKASFALTIESAVIATIIALTGEDGRLQNLTGGWQGSLFWPGVAALTAGALLSIAVVSPSLRTRKVTAEWESNYIFFGHLRHWNPEKLATKLESDPMLPMLSRQLVVMSEIAWKKHRRLQLSFMLAVLGSTLVTIAGILN